MLDLNHLLPQMDSHVQENSYLPGVPISISQRREAITLYLDMLEPGMEPTQLNRAWNETSGDRQTWKL
jgi:hypothetical protein